MSDMFVAASRGSPRQLGRRLGAVACVPGRWACRSGLFNPCLAPFLPAHWLSLSWVVSGLLVAMADIHIYFGVVLRSSIVNIQRK